MECHSKIPGLPRFSRTCSNPGGTFFFFQAGFPGPAQTLVVLFFFFSSRFSRTCSNPGGTVFFFSSRFSRTCSNPGGTVFFFQAGFPGPAQTLVVLFFFFKQVFQDLLKPWWYCFFFFQAICANRGAGLVQWWERSPPTNVSRVRFPDPASYVGWVCCWLSTLLREVFLRVLRFSPLFKNQHF